MDYTLDFIMVTGDRGRLPRELLDWSLASIREHADNDLFSLPFEFEVFHDNWSTLVTELMDLRVDAYQWSEGRRLLLPKDAVSFRHASQLDPLDSLVLTALVRLAGPCIEKKRLPTDRVFTGRVAATGTALYDDLVGWEQFWERSRERAEIDGMGFVARTDIADFYNQVPHAEITHQLDACGVPERICEAFARFLEAFGAGLPRGVPIGPHAGHFFAEVALMRVDRLLDNRGCAFTRFIDDFHVACKTEDDARLALYDIAEVLHDELGLTLNRMKTILSPVKDYISEARDRAGTHLQSQVEKALLEAIGNVTSGSYDIASFDRVVEKNPHAVSAEAIETLFKGLLDSDRERVDYPKLAWLLRRLSQVSAPGGVSYIVDHFEKFVPVIGDTARYLARAGENWDGNWPDLGEKLLEHAKNPIAARSPYVQAVLFHLFAERRELNHFQALVQRFEAAKEPARREVILAAHTAEATEWLHSLRREADTLDSWSRRAFVYGTSILPDRQREECLRSIGAPVKGSDSIVLGSLLDRRVDTCGEHSREPHGAAWAAVRALVREPRRALVDEQMDALGDALDARVYNEVPDDQLLLATWNLRNFGGGGVFGYSDRLPEAFMYIARTLLAFDVIAIQEVRDTANVEQLLKLLGPGWDKVICGEAPGVEGNSEMSAFLYRTTKAAFDGKVEQLVLAKKDLIQGEHQFARPPFLVTFKIGSSRLTACTGHAYFGDVRGAKLARRVAEITALAKLVVSRARKEKSTVFLLGDLNTVGPAHATMAPLVKEEICLPEEFLAPTNAKGNTYYSQIAFKPRHEGFRLRQAGVFPMFDYVFRTEDLDAYREDMETSKAFDTMCKKKRKGAPIDRAAFYDMWRTFQVSDHYPVWVRLSI